jgi:hypothetical protein
MVGTLIGSGKIKLKDIKIGENFRFRTIQDVSDIIGSIR